MIPPGAREWKGRYFMDTRWYSCHIALRSYTQFLSLTKNLILRLCQGQSLLGDLFCVLDCCSHFVQLFPSAFSFLFLASYRPDCDNVAYYNFGLKFLFWRCWWIDPHLNKYVVTRKISSNSTRALVFSVVLQHAPSNTDPPRGREKFHNFFSLVLSHQATVIISLY